MTTTPASAAPPSSLIVRAGAVSARALFRARSSLAGVGSSGASVNRSNVPPMPTKIANGTRNFIAATRQSHSRTCAECRRESRMQTTTSQKTRIDCQR
jgi:hypothetical protein